MRYVLGHYGGIDEIGVFLVPVVLALFALRWSEKRARRNAEEKQDRETNDQ